MALVIKNILKFLFPMRQEVDWTKESKSEAKNVVGYSPINTRSKATSNNSRNSIEKHIDNISNIPDKNLNYTTKDTTKGETSRHQNLYNLASRIMENTKKKCSQVLYININYTKSVIELVIANYKSVVGVKSIEEFVNINIYKALEKYKLKNVMVSNQYVFLWAINGKLIAQIGDERMQLSEDIVNSNNPISKKLESETNKTEFILEEELSKIIGLSKVKNYVKGLNARLRMQNEREKVGLPVDNNQTLHMIFKGNPGTGKTMMARTIAQLLFSIGIIKTNKLIETDRGGLVAGFVGQTAIKTKEKVIEAMDGVLFIDEAYALSQGGLSDFGKEAIDTLVKFMDDNRDRIVVILAGYSKDMDNFLSINPGLKSRFPSIVEFEDYSVEELIQIADKLLKPKAYELNTAARDKLLSIFEGARLETHFGNGRYVRNLLERAVNNQAMRLIDRMNLAINDLVTIIDDDIERV
jgi:SpoVK/Ycf46/Vps4 family AAA+-type ATPase